MKLIGPEYGRVFLFAPQEEIRPLRGLSPLQLEPVIAERYKFQDRPTQADIFSNDKDKRGFELRVGAMRIEDGVVPISRFNIYSDAVAVECMLTDDADRVIADYLEFGRASLGFRAPQREPKRVPSSALVVEFENGLDGLFRSWEQLSRLLNEAASMLPNSAHIEFRGVDFGADPMTYHSADAWTRFRIERRREERFSANRFYSSAPLDSMAHVAFLKQLEALAASR